MNANNTNNTNNTSRPRRNRRRGRRGNQNNNPNNTRNILSLENQIGRLANQVRNMAVINPPRNGRRNRSRQTRAFGETSTQYSRGPAPVNSDMGPALDRMTNSTLYALNRASGGLLGPDLPPRMFGRTAAGAFWGYKYQHPCTDFYTGVPEGIPDETSTNVVTFEQRTLQTITAPSPPADQTFPAGTKWGLYVVNTNLPGVPVLTRAFIEGGANPPVVPAELSQFGTYGDLRFASWGYNVADELTNAYYTSTVGAVPLPVTMLVHAPVGGRHYSKMRSMYKGLTAYMDANAFNDGGRITASNLGLGFDDTSGVIVNYFVGNGNTHEQFVEDGTDEMLLWTIPKKLDETTLMQQGIGTVSRPARNGVYMVSKFRDSLSSIKYKTVHDGYPGITGNNATGLPVEGKLLAVTWTDPTAAAPKEELFNVRSKTTDNDRQNVPAGYVSNSANLIFADHASDLMPTVAIFRGLDLGASITIKTVEGFESQLNATASSTAAVHAHCSPENDEYAIKLAAMVSGKVSGIYEAKDNDLSDVIAKISGVVADVSGFLSSFLPGPYGVGAGAVSAVARAVQAFTQR